MTASTAWGSTECKGSPVRRSVDSGANVMLVVAPDVPIGIYGWLAPATSVLHLIVSMRANSEGVTCSPRSTHADMLFVRALGSVGIWCVGGRKGCGKKDGFKLATFPPGNKTEFTRWFSTDHQPPHQCKGPTQIQTRAAQRRRLTP